jgi:hypothetical protein
MVKRMRAPRVRAITIAPPENQDADDDTKNGQKSADTDQL